MVVAAGDIEYRLSTQAASAGDAQASTPAASLGGWMSTTVMTASSLGNLFADITAAQAAAGYTAYRCLFVLNTNPTDTWAAARAFLVSQVAGGADIALGVDPAGASAMDAVVEQAAEPASETDAPAGVTFATPQTFAAGVSLGAIGPEECIALWFRIRVAEDPSALALDETIFEVRGIIL